MTMSNALNDRDYPASGSIDGRELSNTDIRNAELERARHALAYLKRKVGNENMRGLLSDDLRSMQTTVRQWVEASRGKWRSATLRLVVPGPTAEEFQEWYVDAMARKREADLRAGHPEHFVSHPTASEMEVIENIGETETPWQVFYHSLPEDYDFPSPWDPAYTLHYGMEIVDENGLRVGFSMRESRDQPDGTLQIQFTTHLPQAAPPELVQRHLRHFAIEFRNWTRAALLERVQSDGE